MILMWSGNSALVVDNSLSIINSGLLAFLNSNFIHGQHEVFARRLPTNNWAERDFRSSAILVLRLPDQSLS